MFNILINRILSLFENSLLIVRLYLKELEIMIYIPFFIGVLTLVAGGALFILSFKIFKPILKSERAKERYDQWLENYGKTTKFLSVALILYGVIQVSSNNPDDHIPEVAANMDEMEWTNEDKEKLTSHCVTMYLHEGLPASEIDLAQHYCECTTDKMTQKFTMEDLMSHDTLNPNQKMDLYEPVVETCLQNLQENYNMEGRIFNNERFF